MAELKPGRTTTELGVLALVTGLLALNDKLAELPGPVLYTIASLAAVYIICRTAIKIMAAKPAPLIFGKE